MSHRGVRLSIRIRHVSISVTMRRLLTMKSVGWRKSSIVRSLPIRRRRHSRCRMMKRSLMARRRCSAKNMAMSYVCWISVSRANCVAVPMSPVPGISAFSRLFPKAVSAAGIRRIEAVTGLGAMHWVQDMARRLDDVAVALKTQPDVSA